jgi:hypothetical protein
MIWRAIRSATAITEASLMMGLLPFGLGVPEATLSADRGSEVTIL